MISSPAGAARNVVPRWRSLRRTIESRELAFPAVLGAFTPVRLFSYEFRERLEGWRREPSVVTAAELVEVAIIEGNEREAIAAAHALVSEHWSPTSLVRDQALRLLERQGEVQPSDDGYEDSNPERRLHDWRRRTREHPFDALAWVELARLYVAFGSRAEAIRAMIVARQLAPTNRHVIRSAARMFLHLHRPDLAHEFLRRCEMTRHDPWLCAAEIAIAAHREKPSTFFKSGVALVESEKMRPHQINELAAAIGTTLLKDGNRKRGKRMMARSLADPTGNTLAQAEWITQVLHEPVLEPVSLRMRSDPNADANEAKALHFFNLGDFGNAYKSAQLWIAEEPFSNRAYVAGVTAASAEELFDQTIRLADRGLKYDPHSTAILGNKVFALASIGRVDEAERVLEMIPHDDGVVTHVAEANRGLIAFRRGLNDIGIQQYRLAIAGFRRANDVRHEGIALSYLAREAVRADDPQAKSFVKEAESKIGKGSSPQARKVLEAAKLMLQVSPTRQMTQVARQ